MKGFVLLAALLLVPSVAYFQQIWFEGELQEDLEAGVLADLVSAGVEDPQVQMEWLDATIGGVVDDEEVRTGVPRKVAARPGVRMAAGGNRLKVRGWVRVERQMGEWRAEGLLPKFFMMRPREDGATDWDGGARREEWVEAPIDGREWDEFLKDYFEAPGNRWVELRDGEVALGGEATLGLRADWLSMASGVVPKEEVTGEFVIRPSIYHFEGYIPEVVVDLDRLRELREKLAAAAIGFEMDSEEVAEGETVKVAALASAILEARSGIVFRLEGSPPEQEEGGESLGMRRAKEVARLLSDYGVKEEQLETVAVAAEGSGEAAHRLKIVVK